eukprot:1076223-Rhodomonas_salina.1
MAGPPGGAFPPVPPSPGPSSQAAAASCRGGAGEAVIMIIESPLTGSDHPSPTAAREIGAMRYGRHCRQTPLTSAGSPHWFGEGGDAVGWGRVGKSRGKPEVGKCGEGWPRGKSGERSFFYSHTRILLWVSRMFFPTGSNNRETLLGESHG